MLLTFSGSHYSVVLGRVIQYSSGEGTFSGRVCSRVTISYSNTGGQCIQHKISKFYVHDMTIGLG